MGKKLYRQFFAPLIKIIISYDFASVQALFINTYSLMEIIMNDCTWMTSTEFAIYLKSNLAEYNNCWNLCQEKRLQMFICLTTTFYEAELLYSGQEGRNCKAKFQGFLEALMELGKYQRYATLEESKEYAAYRVRKCILENKDSQHTEEYDYVCSKMHEIERRFVTNTQCYEYNCNMIS